MQSSEMELQYYSDYIVVVSAVLTEADGSSRKLASPLSIFKTVTGKPGTVEDFNLRQVPDTLDVSISWSPPNQPNGLIESYSVEIFDGDNNVFR